MVDNFNLSELIVFALFAFVHNCKPLLSFDVLVSNDRAFH